MNLFYFVFKSIKFYQFLLLDIYCFSLVLFPSMAVYALFHAPCAIATNQKQKGKVFFLVFLTTYALCRAPCVITENQKQWENLKM